MVWSGNISSMRDKATLRSSNQIGFVGAAPGQAQGPAPTITLKGPEAMEVPAG